MKDKHYTRNYEGFKSIMHDMLTDVLGLSEKTVERVMRTIRTGGEAQRTRKHMRKLRSMTFTRLGQAVNRASKDVHEHDKKHIEEQTMTTFKQFLLQEDLAADQAAVAELDKRIQAIIVRKNQLKQNDPQNGTLDKQLFALKQQKANIAKRVAVQTQQQGQQNQQQQQQQPQQSNQMPLR